MTNEKAVKYFKICKGNIDQRIETKVKHSAFELAISALEKQIPKKPYLKDLWELGTMQGTVCPNCETILITAREKYCKHCGQALDWSDTE